MKVVWITVNYKSGPHVERWYAGVNSQKAEDDEIVIVDNSDGEIDPVRFPAAAVIHSQNVGYFKGLNKAIRLARERWPDAELTFVAGNPDIAFAGDFRSVLERCLSDAGESCMVIAPRIVTTDRREQNPNKIRPVSHSEVRFLRFYSSHYLVYSLVSRLLVVRRWLRSKRSGSPNVPKEIYAPHGSLFILTSRFSRIHQELHYPAFLWFEEYFLAEQVRRAGGTIEFRRELVAYHDEHCTTGKELTYEKFRTKQQSVHAWLGHWYG